MAAPRFSPVSPTDRPRHYESPEHVPDAWMPDRPGDIEGFQPDGPRLGEQGPDQGFALRIAAQLRPKVQLQAGEHIDDAIRGCLGVALRRASMFSRAPVVHDLTIAFTIWGWFDEQPAGALVARRKELFEGVANVHHHYTEGRVIADLVPESTLRLTPDAAASAYSGGTWRELTGA